jgi:lipopolysaccharide transport system permease protein
LPAVVKDFSELSEIVHDGSRKTSLHRSLRELAAERECVWAFAERYLRLRYKQAILGVGWAIIKPIALFLPFLVFFGGAAGISGGGVSYAAFSLAVLGAWQYVAASVDLGAGALIVDGQLLRKIYFAREAPVVGAAISNLPDLGIGILIALAAAPFTGANLTLNLLWIPLLAVLITLPAFAVALPFSALAVYYRDFKYGMPLVIQLWLFVSPVAYPITTLPQKYQYLMAAVNPVAGPLEGFRRVLAVGEAPNWVLLGMSAASGTILLVFGYWLFKRLERAFADVI